MHLEPPEIRMYDESQEASNVRSDTHEVDISADLEYL